MSQQLVNHSPDLKKLRDEGYEIEVKLGYLLVHHIPYITPSNQISYGILASELTLNSNDRTAKPGNHVIYFQGDQPCDKNGNVITAIMHSSPNQVLFPGFVANHSFSNKPPEGYNDYYEKIKTYADIIASPAKSRDNSVTEKTFRVLSGEEVTSVFNYIDSNSSRANILQITEKFKDQRIAIVGLGGTGAYILDLVAKCPVNEIHLFDGDNFLQHNSFRSPGAASIEILDQQLKKVDYYKEVYSNMHRKITGHAEFVSEDNINLLNDFSCVFISVDKGGIKRNIIDHLISQNTIFIDVGMGVEKVDDSLIGTLRITTGSSAKHEHINSRISLNDDPNDVYNSNIQIAELNSLNASLAVIKWKKLIGFYNDLEKEYHSTYSINVSQLLNDEIGT